MPTKIEDPKTVKTKPHATTEDQISEMESEGQAQSNETTPAAAADQEIDTAGTEADEKSVVNATNGQSKDAETVKPDDTDSDDIVGPTGETMPPQKHKGVH
jgi:hypothetical protein